ncbi:raffinose/stachyose/melibiose transport system substrate-binding protein [Diaminobutyricimonas aerilata]|uniref:Raffinose/stachyose/melibiose transport system substrate-binding protein n=1 Tax=Diaminobutyricimonas aerilata TaxID=1162967 RepID=A0A2M9CKN9_9MICO|nr:extracellular solute-binding protein [Diaminobutyricimonas aerilata]PJJ72429.1 raffinose/stachyose/melibiose transport system substrate-binding protein [Diaminobutyricimonas aerilata]
MISRATRWAAAVAAASLSVGLAACSSGGDAEGTTTISFLSWTGQEQMEPVLEAFQEAHPEVKVEASYAPPVAEYIQTLQTRVLSGTAPDVFLIAAENKTNLIDAGAVLDLSDEPFTEGVQPFNLDTYGRDGAQYGLSLSSWAAGYAYNVDMLAEVGYDALPETWDEFLELLQKLKDAGHTPFLESVDQMPTTVSAMLGAKSSEMDPSLDERIFSGESTFEEEWSDILEQYNRLYTEGLVSSDVVALDGDQVRDEFANERVAIINAGPWIINAVQEANPDMNWSFGQVPGLEDGKPYQAGAASPGYAINAKSDEGKQEAAKTFLTWLASAEGVEQFQKATNDVTVTDDYTPEINPVFEPMVGPIREGELYLPMIAWQRDEDVLNVEAVAQMQRMIQGEIEPSEVAAALDTKLSD